MTSHRFFCFTQISRISRILQVATPLLAYIAEYNSHADLTDFTEGCIVSLAAVSELSVHIPEANANGVMRYLRNLRNPRETRNSVIV